MASSQIRAVRQGPACRACRAKPACSRCRDASRTCTYDLDRRQIRTDYRFIDETPRIVASTSFSDSGPSRQSQTGESPDLRQSTIEIPATRLAEIESRLEMLTDAVKSMRSSNNTSTSAVDTTVHHTALHDSSANSELSNNGTLDLGHLSLQGNGRARFVAASFWANICDEATAIDELLREQTRYTGFAASNNTRTLVEPADIVSALPDITDTNSMSESAMFPWGDMLTVLDDWDTEPPQSSRYQRVVPDIIAELPPKLLCDHLFDSFVLYYHSIAPLIHVPSTKSDYSAFWQSDTQTRRTKGAPYMSIIIAILFAGANVCDEATITQLSGRLKGDVVTSLHKLTAKTLRYANFPRTPTIESFAAFMIIQNTCMREEQPLTCCSYVGTAVRIAQMLGCNHDPSRLVSLTPVAAEVRRRISWQVYYLDAMVALAAGLPPLIDPHSWSVRPVSELKDELIGTAEGMAYEEDILAGRRAPDDAIKDGSFVSSSSIFVAAKYHTTVTTRAILTKVYGEYLFVPGMLSNVQEELEQLKADISSRIDRLPQDNAVNLQNPEDVFAKWARLLLSALEDRNWTYLYYPLSRTTEIEGREDMLDRQVQLIACVHDFDLTYVSVLRHSHSYLEKMVALTSLEEFGPLQWSWPGIHQPLHAVMVLLRHANRFPNSHLSEANRQTIDEVMALCGPDGGMIGAQNGRLNRRPLREGGQEVWDLIRRLRAQAWVKAGLDPDVLLTRDEIVERVKWRISNGEKARQGPLEPDYDAGGNMSFQLENELLGNLDMNMNLDWIQWD